MDHLSKGQIILKQFLVSSDSSKKNERTNSVLLPNSTKNKFVCSFFGRIRGYQTHCAKVQKYEQGKIGLQFFDMWC